jgi:site-specific DNA recombinase
VAQSLQAFFKTMKSVIYARVSSREQEETGYSLSSQEKLLKEYALKKNFTIVRVFSIAESASGAKQRKAFNEMLDYLEKNNVPHLLCEKVDRLTRNLKEAVMINDWVGKKEERQIHFVKQNLIIHKNSKSDEKFRWDIEIVLAKKYISNLSEEVKKGQKEKLAQGWLPARPPLGYKTIGEKGHKIHIIDEEKASFVKRMFELYSTGNYSLNALVEIMYKEGLKNEYGRKVLKSRMHELLSDPFYYSENRWKGELTHGHQEPLVKKELFDLVQAKLTRKIGSPQYKKHLPVFKAKIQCEECGGTVTWEIQKGHWYGHCNHYRNCSQRAYVRQEKVEEQLFPYFDKIAPKNERVLNWLEKALNDSHSDEVNYNTKRREQFTKTIQISDKRIEEAYKDKLDGKMPVALCEKIISDSTKEKEEAIYALHQLSQSRTSYYEAGYAIHELALNAKNIYLSDKASPEDKRILLSCVFSNLALKADKIKANYTFAFDFLAEWMPRVNKIFEPAKNLSNKRKTDVFTSVNPVLLAWQDSFRTFDWSKALAVPDLVLSQVRQLIALA